MFGASHGQDHSEFRSVPSSRGPRSGLFREQSRAGDPASPGLGMFGGPSRSGPFRDRASLRTRHGRGRVTARTIPSSGAFRDRASRRTRHVQGSLTARTVPRSSVPADSARSGVTHRPWTVPSSGAVPSSRGPRSGLLREQGPFRDPGRSEIERGPKFQGCRVRGECGGRLQRPVEM